MTRELDGVILDVIMKISREILTRAQLAVVVSWMLTACAGPIGMAYTATSTGSLVTTGRSIPEHAASRITDSDCSIWDAIVDLAYICEYNRDPARTYNRTAF